MAGKDIVEDLFSKGYLISPDFAEYLSDGVLDIEFSKDVLLLNQDLVDIFQNGRQAGVDFSVFETALFKKERGIDNRLYENFIKSLHSESSHISSSDENQECDPVKIVFTDEEQPQKIEVGSFVSYLNKRFSILEEMLRAREELSGVTSISRLAHKKARESCAIIGMVYDKQETKNNNIILSIEDTTGKINVLVSKNKPELFDDAKDIVLDEMLGITGMSGDNIIFADSLVHPDIPLVRGMKKSKEEVYAAFLGDPHFGSKVFLKQGFEKLITWLEGKTGSEEQRRIAEKLKYVFLVGDLVEGVGIYPGQEEDLEILEVSEQYKRFAEYLNRIPERIHIIICPGNHDAGRISEPQLALPRDYAADIYARPNTYLVSNPSWINIMADKDFPGFDILLYHGYSFIYYAENVESIKNAGGQKRPDLIMRYLLTRRHLAPTHTSNLYIPYKDRDPLVISRIPDFFVSGHIHRVSVANYRSVTLINSSCWTEITEDQEKRGLEPQPGKLPVVNLKTRDVKVLNFA